MFLDRDEIGEFECEVTEIENVLIDQYEEMLSKYGEWISSKREIKIASLLNPDVKIQFDIESLSILAFANEVDYSESRWDYKVDNIKDVAIHIKGMTFILKDGIVEKLTLKCRRMETPMGKVVSNIMDAGIDIDMKQMISEYQVKLFYIDTNHKKLA
jgi:hypothetical protein